MTSVVNTLSALAFLTSDWNLNLHFKVCDSLSFVVLVDLEKGREGKLKEAEIKAVRKGRNGKGREGKERNEKGRGRERR